MIKFQNSRSFKSWMFFKDPTLFNQWIYMTFPVIHGLLDKNQEKIIYLNIFDSQCLPDKIAWH